ncbi:MATE family efflux transporter [Chloroflexota bacterium]
MKEEVGGPRRRGARFERDWTKGSIVRNLWLLSWPMTVHEIFFTGSNIVDMIFVGRLGATSIAGVGVASMVARLVESAAQGLVIGARAMVARFVGAGDDRGANHVVRQALIISAVYGALVTIIGVLFVEPILNLFGLEADVIVEGVAYMRIIFAGWMFTSFWVAAYGIIQASGDTVTAMKITIFTRSVRMVLDPFLIFGWWLFPRLGVGGAATAHVISQSLAISLALWVLFRGRTRLRLTLRGFRLDTNIIGRIVKIGIPAAVMNLQRAFGNLVLTRFMVPFGTLAVAAHSLVHRAEMILHIPNITLGRGAGVLVGQNLGAGQPERAERSGWLAVSFVEAFMLIGSVAILLWAESIIRIFNSEPALVQLASIFLRIAAAGYLVLGFTSVLQQVISVAGDTIPPMLISLAMIWLVQLPLAFLLPRVTELGVYGVRWAIVAGLVVGAVACITYFRLGRWKRKKV